MKITIISLIFVLMAIGCSKKGGTSTPARFTVANSDITPSGITTNIYKGTPYYIIQLKLSSAKEAEFWKLVQQHPEGEIEVELGSETHKMRMSTRGLRPPIRWAWSFSSMDDAVVAEKELSQQ